VPDKFFPFRIDKFDPFTEPGTGGAVFGDEVVVYEDCFFGEELV